MQQEHSVDKGNEAYLKTSAASDPISERLLAVIRRRQNPGLLLFDDQLELLYRSPEALRLLYPFTPRGSSLSASLPETILDLCRQLRVMLTRYTPMTARTRRIASPAIITLMVSERHIIALRALHIHGSFLGHREDGLILVMIEPVSDQRRLSIREVAERFRLSKRESEILDLLSLGSTNKEIAKNLNIVVDTVEKHITNITTKTGTRNRAGILAKLLDAVIR